MLRVEVPVDWGEAGPLVLAGDGRDQDEMIGELLWALEHSLVSDLQVFRELLGPGLRRVVGHPEVGEAGLERAWVRVSESPVEGSVSLVLQMILKVGSTWAVAEESILRHQPQPIG